MKNKTLLQKLNQAASEIESADPPNDAILTLTDSETESETAIFYPSLIQILNTYIDLAIGTGFSGSAQTRKNRLSEQAGPFAETSEGMPI